MHARQAAAASPPDGIADNPSAAACPPDGICPVSGGYIGVAADALTEQLRSAFLEASLHDPTAHRPHCPHQQLDSLIAFLAAAVEALLRLGGGCGASVTASVALVREGAALGRWSLSADPARHAICAGEGTLAAWLEACDEMEEGIGVFARRLAACPAVEGPGRGQHR
jgi:hypothetical protein